MTLTEEWLIHMSGGAGGSGPDSDWPAVGAGLAQLADFINEAKRFSLFGIQNGGGGSPIQCIEKIGARLCVSLDNLSRNLNVAAKSLDRFVNATQSLSASEAPIVFVDASPRSK